MKFLCVECDRRMDFAERDVPGDGTMAAVFECDGCGRAVAMLTNPMETQLVSSLGVKVGGREVPDEPMEATRDAVAEPRGDAFDAEGRAAADEDASAGEGGGDEDAPGAGAARDAPAGGGRADGGVEWTEAALDRLDRVPSFVRGMVHRIYTDYAQERGIAEITPDVMDRARSDLGLEGM